MESWPQPRKFLRLFVAKKFRGLNFGCSSAAPCLFVAKTGFGNHGTIKIEDARNHETRLNRERRPEIFRLMQTVRDN